MFSKYFSPHKKVKYTIILPKIFKIPKMFKFSTKNRFYKYIQCLANIYPKNKKRKQFNPFQFMIQ